MVSSLVSDFSRDLSLFSLPCASCFKLSADLSCFLDCTGVAAISFCCVAVSSTLLGSCSCFLPFLSLVSCFLDFSDAIFASFCCFAVSSTLLGSCSCFLPFLSLVFFPVSFSSPFLPFSDLTCFGSSGLCCGASSFFVSSNLSLLLASCFRLSADLACFFDSNCSAVVVVLWVCSDDWLAPSSFLGVSALSWLVFLSCSLGTSTQLA